MKTWREKYKEADAKGGIRKLTNKGMMYISSPSEISEIIKLIPKGKIMSTKQIAQKLSEKHNVDYTCGLTTGIFVAIIANYVEQDGIDNIPYWRVVKNGNILYETYLREPSQQENYLKKEGHRISKKGTLGTKIVSI